MARTAEKIAAKARQYNIRLIFVIIPTKEFVYAKKMLDEGITPREDYTLLVRDEQKNINDLAIRLKNIPGSAYIDLPSRLQAEAQRFPFLYPMTENGHPAEFGYEVIAGALAPYVRQLLPQKLSGPVVVNTHNKKFYYVVHKEGVWLFANEKILTGNGWNPGLATPISQRFIENMPITASVMTINPEQFGPGSTLIK